MPTFSPMQNQYSQRPQTTNTYKNQLDGLMQNPGSFTSTPGYQFGLDSAMQGVQRSQSAGRNSGNALAALVRTGEGYAGSRYGEQMDRLGRLSGQQDQFNTQTEQNRLTGENNTNQYNLTGNRDQNQFSLGQEQNRNTATNNANQFSLGQEQNYNTSRNNDWQNSNNEARNANDWNTQQQRNQIDWFGARTQRGNARTNNWNQYQNINWS